MKNERRKKRRLNTLFFSIFLFFLASFFLLCCCCDVSAKPDARRDRGARSRALLRAARRPHRKRQEQLAGNERMMFSFSTVAAAAAAARASTTTTFFTSFLLTEPNEHFSTTQSIIKTQVLINLRNNHKLLARVKVKRGRFFDRKRKRNQGDDMRSETRRSVFFFCRSTFFSFFSFHLLRALSHSRPLFFLQPRPDQKKNFFSY